MWQQWVNLVVGIWVIIVPNIGMSTAGVRNWEIVNGIIIIIFALWGALTHNAKRMS